MQNNIPISAQGNIYKYIHGETKKIKINKNAFIYTYMKSHWKNVTLYLVYNVICLIFFSVN